MDDRRFWSLIDEARTAGGATSHALRPVLARLEPDEIASFGTWFDAYFDALRRGDLWAAVSAIRGGCGDDAFDYFRGWLIGRGEEAMLRAVRDPESLVEIVGDAKPTDELMLSAASEAFEKVAGRELPMSTSSPKIPDWPRDRIAQRQKWDDAFYAANFPKLHARYFANRPAPPTGTLDRARFFEILGAAKLATALDALTTPELIGFDRWLQTYNQVLMRNDIRAACRILLGEDDMETYAGFRGWLLLQGEKAIDVATHELDALLEHVRLPVVPRSEIIFSTMRAFESRDVYRGAMDPSERMPLDVADWTPDLEAKPSADTLRARFPRLMAAQPPPRKRS